MKIKLKYRVIFSLIAGIIWCSCNAEQNNNVEYKPVSADLSGVSLCLLTPPKNGCMNVVIKDNKTKRIVLNIAELKQNRIALLEFGEYGINADGIAKNIVTITEDCKINFMLTGGGAIEVSTIEPPPIAFRRGNQWNISTLTEGASYFLSIFNSEGKDTKAFSAGIKGPGGYDRNIPLSTKTENNRILSVNSIALNAGQYTAEASVNGDDSIIPTVPFTVKDNDTAGPVLVNKADNFKYRSSLRDSSISLLMTDDSGIDSSKTFIEIGGNRYRPAGNPVKENNNEYRLDFTIPLREFAGKHHTVSAVCTMVDNDRNRGDADQAVQQETISITEDSGYTQRFALLWNNRSLQYAGIQYFVFDGYAQPRMTKAQYNTFRNNNSRNLLSGNSIVNTAETGQITINGLHDRDQILFAAGVNLDEVYTKKITVYQNNRALSVYFTGSDIPAKKLDRFNLYAVDRITLDSLRTASHLDIYLYYQPGSDREVPRNTFLSGRPERVLLTGFTNLVARGESTIEISGVELPLSKVTNANYLIEIEAGSSGKFVTNNSILESSLEIAGPTIYKEN
jgi:hypothetical protein